MCCKVRDFAHPCTHAVGRNCPIGGGVECVCCAWANVCGIPGVALPPRASQALLLGTYGEGMRMETSSPKKWRREVLESHLGLSRGTTSGRKNLRRLGHHHRLAVDRQRALYNGARQWKESQKCMQNHVHHERSGLLLIPTSHRMTGSRANSRRTTAFLANVPWVAWHLDSKVQHSTKEVDVWEECHDASLLAWGVVYGNILHGMRCFDNVAQLRAPTGAHLATATGMLQARLQNVAQEEGPGWLLFKEQAVAGAWHGVQLVQFDSGGQKCATTSSFPGVQTCAVTDVLLAVIKEGQATIGPGGVLK